MVVSDQDLKGLMNNSPASINLVNITAIKSNAETAKKLQTVKKCLKPRSWVQILVHVKTDGLKASSGNQECYVFFITGQIGDSRLIRLARSSVRGVI